MYRIDGPGATNDNKFTQGNPTTGTPATQVTADFMNALQEEIAKVIEESGIALSKVDNGQLYAALQLMIGMVGGVPDATDVVKGKVELATNTECTTGTDTTRAVTPAGLAAAIAAAGAAPPPDASTTVKGIVELATNAECTTGTDAVRAVTPAGLAAAIAAAVVAATTTVAGKVELATNSECTTGTDTVRAVTPAGLAAAIAAAAVGAATTSVAGKVELATNAETQTGSDTVRAVTPAGAAATYAKKSGDTFTGAVNAPSFNTTSARRYKTEISGLPTSAAMDAIRHVEIINYRLLDSPDREHVGVIAEQLIGTPLEAFVNCNDDGDAESVDYTSLFAIALSALQQADARLSAIERRLAAGGLWGAFRL